MAGSDLLRLMRNLRAVREFTAAPVAEQTLIDILEVGRWTGTGSNRQPTDVVVVRDPEVKEKMGEWGARPAAAAAVVLLLATLDEAGPMDEGRYAERPLGANDQVYRGSDGRYYCRRSDGTIGLVVGAGVGALLGRGIDTRGERGTGTILGATLGALLGRTVERNADVRCR